jgi:hypothetical protein
MLRTKLAHTTIRDGRLAGTAVLTSQQDTPEDAVKQSGLWGGLFVTGTSDDEAVASDE